MWVTQIVCHSVRDHRDCEMTTSDRESAILESGQIRKLQNPQTLRADRSWDWI